MLGANQAVPAVSRRRLLAGVGLSALAGVGAGVLRGFPSSAQDPTTMDAELTIRAATVWRNGYAGLVGDADDDIMLHELHFGADGNVAIGGQIDTLPHEFQAWGVAAIGDRLWVTGTNASLFEVVTVENGVDHLPEELREVAGEGDPELPDGVFEYEEWRYRPALYVVGQGVEQVDLTVPERIGWGVATGIVTDGARSIIVAIDGSPHPDAGVITRTHLAGSTDGGQTWRQRLLDDSLHEGYATSLVGTEGRLLALSVDGAGTRRLRSGFLGSDPDLDLVDAVDGAGPVVAAVPDGQGGVKVLTQTADGSIGIDAYRRDTLDRRDVAESGPCACATTNVVAVNGADGLWIAVTADGARLGS
jgi:hypothetical protein